MAQPQKKAPRPKMVDFDSLEVETFDASKESASVKSIDRAPKLLAMFKQSYESLGTEKVIGHKFKVPTVNAKQTENLIRAAARRFNSGVQIGLLDKPGGVTEVSFSAAKKKVFTKPRKPIAPKRKAGESAGDWRKRQEKYNTAMNAWRRANPDKA